MEGDFYGRVVADGAVGVPGGGPAQLVAASGLTASVLRNGLGDVTVTFSGPVTKLGIQDPDSGDLNVPLTFIQLGSGVRGFVQYSYPTTSTLRVLTFNASNAAADMAFQFLLKSTQRRLV